MPIQKPSLIRIILPVALFPLLAANAFSAPLDSNPSDARADTATSLLPIVRDTQVKQRTEVTSTHPSRKPQRTEIVSGIEANLMDSSLAAGDSPIRRGRARGESSTGKPLGEQQQVDRWPSLPGLGLGPVRLAPIKPVLIPPPQPSDITLSGDTAVRSMKSILRALRSQVRRFEYSYERILREHPKVHGAILLEFTIAPSGDVVALDVASSTTKSPLLDNDIKEKARRMQFESIETGNVHVRYMLTLQAQAVSTKNLHKPTRPPM